MEIEFPYTEEESRTFGLVKRPRMLRLKVGDREFEAPVAIADSNDVPSIFGRVKCLDLFDVNFTKGTEVKLCWEE